MDKTLSVIEKLCSLWEYNIKMGRKYNTPLSIGFSDEQVELLTCVEHNLKGTGSISHGYDHDNQEETKFVSLVQPKKCVKCGSKMHFFTEKCICGSNDFKYVNDSRWGIDSNAHFEYKIPFYHLWVLYPDNYEYTCNKFYLKQYVIDSNNKAFNDILEVQMERGKTNNKNYLPYSSDFFISNPKEVSSFEILIDNLYGVVVTRQKVNDIIFDTKIINKLKRDRVLESSFLNIKDNYLYEELLPYINIKDKKTLHGKKRGKTTRRNQ